MRALWQAGVRARKLRNQSGDSLSNGIGIVEQLFVANANEPQSVLLQGEVAQPIPFAPVPPLVDRAVQLDDKPGFCAEEVRNERTDGVLSTKLLSVESAISQKLPEQLFRPRRRAAKLSCE